MIDQNTLKCWLDYNPASGIFRWKVSRPGSATVGSIAGELTNTGYIRIQIKRRRYLAHRLVWVWMFNRWPPHQVDHKNGNRADNRLSNLREATFAENQLNTGPRKHNTSGFKGVTKSRNHWKAGFRRNGKFYHLGVFETAEMAAAAYRSAVVAIDGNFARTE